MNIIENPLEEYFKRKHCSVCKDLTEYFLKHNPDRKGYALCQKCMLEQGIVPLDLLYDPKTQTLNDNRIPMPIYENGYIVEFASDTRIRFPHLTVKCI